MGVRGGHTPEVVRREDVAEALHPINGRRLVVSYEYRRARDRPRQIATPLQSEFTWYLRVVQERIEVGRCQIRSWTGDFDGVAPSPDGRVAAVRWNDQTEAGLVLVEISDQPRQLRVAWDTRETNWLEGPGWTRDSHLLVLVENPPGAGSWWAQAPDEVSPGGTFTPGSLVVLDRDLQERSRRRITVELPSGWFPANDVDRGLGIPAIEPSGDVTVRVPAEGDFRIPLRDL
jgi:hypothetical protein